MPIYKNYKKFKAYIHYKNKVLYTHNFLPYDTYRQIKEWSLFCCTTSFDKKIVLSVNRPLVWKLGSLVVEWWKNKQNSNGTEFAPLPEPGSLLKIKK
jgi:hypothetical protein